MKKILSVLLIGISTMVIGATPLPKEEGNNVKLKSVKLDHLEVLLTEDMANKMKSYIDDVKMNQWDEDSVLVISPSCLWKYNNTIGEDKNCVVEFDIDDAIEVMENSILGTYVEYEVTKNDKNATGPTYNIGLYEMFGPRYEFFKH